MPVDCHILSVPAVTLDFRSIVAAPVLASIVEQAGEVDTLEQLVVAVEVLVGIQVEGAVVRTAVRTAVQQPMLLGQAHSILEDILGKEERSCTRWLLVGADLEELGMQKESSRLLKLEVYTEPSLQKYYSKSQLIVLCGEAYLLRSFFLLAGLGLRFRPTTKGPTPHSL